MLRISYDTDVTAERASDEPDVEGIRWRGWHAYHQLPHGRNGRLPSQRSLEDAHDLSNSTLTKLFRGRLVKPDVVVGLGVADALNCDARWLWLGRGAGPKSVRHTPDLPAVDLVVTPVISDGGDPSTAASFRGTTRVRSVPRKNR